MGHQLRRGPGRRAARGQVAGARWSSTRARDVITLRVENTGDRLAQVGSHYHFAETNPALAFDRLVAWGAA